MSHRTRVLIFIVATIAVVFAGRWINYPALAGRFKGDEGTYVSMAFSAAEDFDLAYDRRDLERFGRIAGTGRDGRPAGPEGIFLKPGKSPTDVRLEYAKAFIYPVAAAPFARIGGLGGLLIFNLLLLAGCVWCAVRFCAARVGGWRGHLIALAFLCASSAPVWVVWLTPEMFNFALIFYAYFLWAYKEVRPGLERSSFLGGPWSDLIAAVLIGLATFSKPTNAPLIAPLVTFELWHQWRAGTRLFALDLRRAIAISVVFFAVALGLFGVNKLITGTASYQAGGQLNAASIKTSRKTFYGYFPFDDKGSTYENARNSNEMVTDSADISHDILFPGDPHFWPLLGHNVWYFFSGRDSGFVPYFFPGALILLLWVRRWREIEAWQVFSLLAASGVALFLLVWTPYTWNGAGGPPGSRYLLSEYPVLLFLVPASTGAFAGVASWVVGLAFIGPMLLSPFVSSLSPWTIPERAPLSWLPIELTMMDDIPARLNPSRGRLLFGNPRNAMLYYMDAGTYNPEGQGFWVAGGVRADIVVRVSEDARTPLMRLTASSPIANDVTINWGGATCAMSVRPDHPASCELRAGPGVWAHGGIFVQLSVTTTAGFVPSKTDPTSADHRNLGVFLEPVFEGQPIR